ncbi:MAG: putative indolepyruvate oxidoreductase subunit [Rhizobacter sp.]|nr:putative indolepyruvate oxidoreductase subunit [Rhizobacter sp.]
MIDSNAVLDIPASSSPGRLPVPMQPGLAQPLKIAILAMGGEGGGVLADWIVDLGEHNGYIAQTTSVPGVAQRTGATIYYVELFPEAAAKAAGARPVLALMPTPGDVDVVMASELMEAGRAVQRGLVTFDRTTLIASTHRVYSIGEKSSLGDGTVDSTALVEQCTAASKRFVRFDMAGAADRSGSVISAVIFGALCATEVLPFTRAQFEATIERGGVGVKPSLKAFGVGMSEAVAPPPALVLAPTSDVALKPVPTTHANPAVAALLRRVRTQFEEREQPLIAAGVARLIDYQDVPYAALYLDRVARIARHDDRSLTQEFARHLSLWMSFEDVIRVADLKTRGSRFERVRKEVKARDDQLLAINEFMHPRFQEIAETMPVGLGRWLLNSGAPRRFISRFTQEGRVVRTSSLGGYLMLYTLAGLRRWRLSSLKYRNENERIEAWIARVDRTAESDAALALEITQCQRLVKGYSETLERGTHNYEVLMAATSKLSGPGAASTVAALRDAALADEHGNQLRAVLASKGLV